MDLSLQGMELRVHPSVYCQFVEQLQRRIQLPVHVLAKLDQLILLYMMPAAASFAWHH